MTADIREGTVDVDGLAIHYADRPGPGLGGRTIVLVHGLNAQLHTWDPIARQLSTTHRVVALDLRGHGDSDWTKRGYPLAGFVDDLAGLIETLGLERIALVGHSLGVRVCLAYAAEHSGFVDRLVLSDAGPELSRTGAKRVQGNKRNTQSRGFRSIGDAVEEFRTEYPRWQPEFHDLHAEYQLRLNWAGKYVWKSDPELFWLSGSAGSVDNDYLWMACARVTCPTLILRGQDSYLFDEDISRRMQTAMADCREVVFSTDHYIPREAPAVFVEAVREFVEESSQ